MKHPDTNTSDLSKSEPFLLNSETLQHLLIANNSSVQLKWRLQC